MRPGVRLAAVLLALTCAFPFLVFSAWAEGPAPVLAVQVLRRLGLAARFDHYPVQLSGGERQMLALGRALMGKPKLLMLDEPSLGLAPAIVSEMFRIIQSLNKMGTTILLVEQNAREALRISNRAYVMETGRIILTGAGAELLNNEEVKRAFLGNDYKEKWER